MTAVGTPLAINSSPLLAKGLMPSGSIVSNASIPSTFALWPHSSKMVRFSRSIGLALVETMLSCLTPCRELYPRVLSHHVADRAAQDNDHGFYLKERQEPAAFQSKTENNRDNAEKRSAQR